VESVELEACRFFQVRRSIAYALACLPAENLAQLIGYSSSDKLNAKHEIPCAFPWFGETKVEKNLLSKTYPFGNAIFDVPC